MDCSDRKKLLDAGFRIMRSNIKGGAITELVSTGWRLVGRYDTKSGQHKAVMQLRLDEKIIFKDEDIRPG